MTMTDFLTANARNVYRSVDELWAIAKTSPLMRKGEKKFNFLKLLGQYLSKYRDGNLPNGLVFYTELPFGKHKATVKMPSGKNVALIKLANPM